MTRLVRGALKKLDPGGTGLQSRRCIERRFGERTPEKISSETCIIRRSRTSSIGVGIFSGSGGTAAQGIGPSSHTTAAQILSGSGSGEMDVDSPAASTPAGEPSKGPEEAPKEAEKPAAPPAAKEGGDDSMAVDS